MTKAGIEIGLGYAAREIADAADIGGALGDGNRAARIEKLVFVDPHTGVYNRSYYDLQIRNEIARATREDSSSVS